MRMAEVTRANDPTTLSTVLNRILTVIGEVRFRVAAGSANRLGQMVAIKA